MKRVIKLLVHMDHWTCAVKVCDERNKIYIMLLKNIATNLIQTLALDVNLI